MEERNIGIIEQAVRIAVGSLASLSGIILLVPGRASLASGAVGVVLAIAGLYLFVTGSAGYCPIYRRLSWNTRQFKRNATTRTRTKGGYVAKGAKATALVDAPLVPIHDGGHRMDSARGIGLVMRSRTIHPLPWEATGCAMC